MNLMVKNLSRFKLITFDATDTIVRFSRAPALQYANAAAKFGYDRLNQDKIQLHFRQHFKRMNTKYPNFGRNSEIDWTEWWKRLVKDVYRSTGEITSETDLDQIAVYLIEQFKTAESWETIPGSDELINSIRKCDDNKIIGVISNMDPRINVVLKCLNLPEFDFILNSYDAGHLKPAHEIFYCALQQCNKRWHNYSCHATEALHIGNTPSLDYIGARAAGWSSVLIGPATQNDLTPNIRGDHVFSSLNEFARCLKTSSIKW